MPQIRVLDPRICGIFFFYSPRTFQLSCPFSSALKAAEFAQTFLTLCQYLYYITILTSCQYGAAQFFHCLSLC